MSQPQSFPRREKVAILGGGMASLSAAFALTDTPELRARYALTVYQDGWLLGGKGASVRNRDARGRIEEHGLHVWLGYYENAFTLLRRCYEELGRPPGAAMRTLRDAFVKHGAISVGEKTRRGWEHWSVTFPETSEWPGDGRPLPGAGEAIRGAAAHVLRYALAWWKQGKGARPEVADVTGQLRGLLQRVLAMEGSLLVGEAARALADGVRSLLERLRSLARRDLEADTQLRRVWVVLEFSAVSLIGILRDGILGPDVDVEALDAIEYSDWLRKHGASEMTVSSGLIRAFYHFAFCDGDGSGAGLAVLGMLRMFTCYRGAVFYKMRAGMGETVFAPLYEVLRRRGVRFEFFHRVRRLELSVDQRRVERVVVDRQATPTDGVYRPLIDVGGLPCWPEQPLYGQLVEGEALSRHGAGLASFWSDWTPVEQRTLRHGTDFDRVLLGISLGALPSVASELIAASPRWRRMVEHVKTVRTVSAQLWVTEPLGPLASSADAPMMTAYQVPLETWADMSHLIPTEGWKAGDGVQGILYACGQLGHGDDPVAASDPRVGDRAALEAVARGAVGEQLAHLWPGGADARGGLRWELLFDAEGRTGPERLRSQYLRVNADPSDRYVLSVPGSQKHRIAPDASGFEGLVLAGDWTRTGYDLGCIEAATMSGLMAARALGAEVSIVGEVPRPRAEPEVSLPLYVDRPGEMSLRSPYVMEDVWLTALVLRARQGALGALLDRYLNVPARGHVRYVPAAPFVVLTSAFAGRAFSGDPEHRRLGYMPETDIAFWVPAWAMRAGTGGLIPERLVWFMPHVFVSTGAAAAAGREIYGFPKSVVDVEVRRSGRALEHLSVLGEVLARHSPETRGERARILEVTRSEVSPGPVRSVAEVIGELIRPMDSSGGWASSIARSFAMNDVTIAFLKQFRDVQHTDRACYQAIIEAKASVRALRGYGPLPGTFHVSWGDHASHPFTTDLGLDPGGQQAIAATWAEFDFVMESGRELFRAGGQVP
ncbi:FAD-dependent oxidoreductase [Pyxidicoccus caerfyrddinensis]|uniref:FAD-dependent oxidoreductase n=1 Tax=Pyxidicoccus caerfyrddinensis TaxID=2709663 RepID=UPI0013DA5EB2|nr:FAD-dependent oxidoreductase [Pyxidicoccus caerfyrddinensis]